MIFRGDPSLLDRFRAGEEDALEAVYWACVEQVTRTAHAVLRACLQGGARGTTEIATELSDVVQEVFVKAFAVDARRRFDGTRDYAPYLAQIARNVAVDHWRKMRRYVPADVERLLQQLSVEVEAFEVHAEAWSDGRTMELVELYVAALDPESRLVHEALYVKGMSQRDAATALGLGRQVIRTREAKLREGLKRELARAVKPVPVAGVPLRVVSDKKA